MTEQWFQQDGVNPHSLHIILSSYPGSENDFRRDWSAESMKLRVSTAFIRFGSPRFLFVGVSQSTMCTRNKDYPQMIGFKEFFDLSYKNINTFVNHMEPR